MNPSRSNPYTWKLNWLSSVSFLCVLFAFTNIAFAVEIPEVKDLSIWDLPDLNPKVLQEGRFYYGIQVKGQLYFTVLTREKDAEIGRRAGGHFKLVKGWMMDHELKIGKSKGEAEAIGQRAFKLQAEYKEKFHPAQGFGFKAVRSNSGELVLKWHGFNSIKSTIHRTSSMPGMGMGMGEIIFAVSQKYGIGSEIVHPILDPDLKINPKYLDPSYENYRGEAALWDYTRRLAEQIIAVNKRLGHTNTVTESILEMGPAKPKGCGKMFSGVLDFFGQ